jgi:hypothetical protein
MLRAEDMGDDFWNVRARESAETDAIHREIRDLIAQIDVARKTDTIRNAPGFADWFKSLQTMHAATRERLVGDARLTDAGLRETRGQVQGMERVLALASATKNLDPLERRLAECKNALAEAIKRRPKQEVTT